MPAFLFDVVVTFVAGFLDAVGVTYLSGIYVSFMSGNSIGLGIAVAHQRTAIAVPIASAITSFVLGAFIGSLIVLRVKPATTVVLVMEVALIGVSVVTVHHADGFVALLPVCLAMGMQNAIPRSVAGAAIGRSFVTGELFGVGRSMAMSLQDRSQITQAALHGASWITIVLGAIGGATSLTRFGLIQCLAASAAALFALMVVDAWARSSERHRNAKLSLK